MPYPMLPEDFASRASLLQRIGDVIQGPWGRQPVESGVPIVPGTGQPGGVPPPITLPSGKLTSQQIMQLHDETMAQLRAVPNAPRGTPLSQMMKEEPMWTRWGQDMGIPVDRLLKAVPALRQNWNMSDNEIKHLFAMYKQRGEL